MHGRQHRAEATAETLADPDITSRCGRQRQGGGVGGGVGGVSNAPHWTTLGDAETEHRSELNQAKFVRSICWGPRGRERYEILKYHTDMGSFHSWRLCDWSTACVLET